VAVLLGFLLRLAPRLLGGFDFELVDGLGDVADLVLTVVAASTVTRPERKSVRRSREICGTGWICSPFTSIISST